MGRLIWLMGPSGSGKDSLLSALRQREHPQLLVAHRYITRAANAGSENHIALSEPEFFTRAGQNLLALSWHANGYYYGIGIEPGSTCWSTAHARTFNKRAPAMKQRCCRSVCRSRLMCCAAGCRAGVAKTPKRSSSGLNVRRAIPHRTVISSITTEVCYSQSITF